MQLFVCNEIISLGAMFDSAGFSLKPWQAWLRDVRCLHFSEEAIDAVSVSLLLLLLISGITQEFHFSTLAWSSLMP